MIHLSIVIPAYNEEKRISKCLDDYLSFYSNQDTEIIVVLNNCTDNTKRIVLKYQDRYSNIKYLEYQKPIGKGGAVKQGFLIAQGEYIGFIDADDATSAKEFDKLVKELDAFDGAIASRWLPESTVKNRTVLRKITSKLFAVMVKLIFSMPFSDTQCGAKIFKKNKIVNIIKKIKETGMAFDVELLYHCWNDKMQIKEVAVNWVDQPDSPSLGSLSRVSAQGFSMINRLINIKKDYGKKSNF